MSKLATTYIAIGSNQHDRARLLQKSIDKIYKKVGDVVAVSHVYETAAWGFDGDPFLNACVKVKTRLKPNQLLHDLLQIEIDLGRQRKTNAYENRPIDLDILFYDDQIIDEVNLKIPHKALQKRDFVLYPLADIAAELEHPILHRTINDFKTDLESSQEILKTEHQIYPRQLPILDINYLCIEGNIGAGKTTFCKMLSEDYNAKLILERFKDNPFLPQFYQDPKRYAFPTEMAFLADRHQQLVDDISQLDLFSQFSIADYDLYKSLIFAKVTLQEQEYELYKKVFNIIYREIPKPDLYIYFYQNTERLLENIRKRGRAYEQDIKAEYLENINQGYLEFIKHENRFRTKIIDVSTFDFVNNREDYVFLVQEILKVI